MTRLFRRSGAKAATVLLAVAGLAVAGLGLAAGTSHASDRRDDGRGDDYSRLMVSINTGPVCWEQPNPMDPCQVRISLSYPVEVPVTVTLDTMDGTAVAPADYVPLSGWRVTVPAGEVVLEVPLEVVDDGVPEPDEWFLATISATSVGSVGTGRAVVTIGDGAPPGS